jgi:deazaflavin-dependent oxidoreductase (nitroreductase family)
MPRALPPPGSRRLRLVNFGTGLHVLVYRLSRGHIGGTVSGVPVLLLNHVGRRSGRTRTTPLGYLKAGDDLVIVASRAGSQAPPAWWWNLQATSAVSIEVRGERRSVIARRASSVERARLWPKLLALYPTYAEYQRRTTRELAVVILSPA